MGGESEGSNAIHSGPSAGKSLPSGHHADAGARHPHGGTDLPALGLFHARGDAMTRKGGDRMLAVMILFGLFIILAIAVG